ncbi:hypothetical protein HK096_010384, partial [Nowakowskiella sp. JEL0078]
MPSAASRFGKKPTTTSEKPNQLALLSSTSFSDNEISTLKDNNFNSHAHLEHDNSKLHNRRRTIGPQISQPTDNSRIYNEYPAMIMSKQDDHDLKINSAISNSPNNFNLNIKSVGYQSQTGSGAPLIKLASSNSAHEERAPSASNMTKIYSRVGSIPIHRESQNFRSLSNPVLKNSPFFCDSPQTMSEIYSENGFPFENSVHTSCYTTPENFEQKKGFASSNKMEIPKKKSIVVLVTGCEIGTIGFLFAKSFAGIGCLSPETEIDFVVFAAVSSIKSQRDICFELLRRKSEYCNDSKFDDSKFCSDNYIPEKIHPLLMDVSDGISVKKGINMIIDRCGGVDILINTESKITSGALSKINLLSVRRTFETNILGMLRVVQHCIPWMLCGHQDFNKKYRFDSKIETDLLESSEKEFSKRIISPRIINIGSMVGFTPIPWSGAYCASRSAIHSLT